MREMKDSGIEWIGKIPKDWKITQARRLFNNKKEVVGDAVDQYERLALTLNGVIKRSKEDSEGLQPEKFEGYQILRKNNLVFKMIDLENVNTSRVGLSPYTGLVSPAYIVFSNNRDDNRYPYYWFMSMYYHEVFNHLGGDGVRSALNAKDMLSLPIPNISETEQAYISDYLDEKCAKIDAIIEKQQEIIEKLKEYKLSIITEAVTKGLNPYVEMVSCDVGYTSEMPANWTLAPIKKVTEFITCGVAATPEYTDKENGFLFLSAQNVKDGKMDYSVKRYIVPELHESLTKKRKPRRGDVLQVRVGATIGNVAVVDTDEPYSVYVSLTHMRTNDNVTPEFFKYSLNNSLFQQKAMSYVDFAGSQGNLNVADMKQLKILLPSIEEQKEIVKYLDKICLSVEGMIEKRNSVIEKYQEIKKTLIYEVVTGKREV